MDKNHLRFFTLDSIRRMLGEAGFEVKDIGKRLSGAPWLKLMNRLLGSQLADFLVRQYIVVGIKR
jgi:hypothetical protein